MADGNTSEAELLAQLAYRLERKKFGKHKGYVVNNVDPLNLGRVQVKVPTILNEAPVWAMPCMPYGGINGQGWYAIPEVDATVWIEFEAGEVDKPIWVGTFWPEQGGELPDAPGGAGIPENKVFRTPSGHYLAMEDAADNEFIHLHHASGSEIQMNPAGSVAITDSSGAAVTMDADGGVLSIADANGNTITMDSSGTVVEDANGNKIEMGAAGVTVKGTTVVVKGEQVTLGGDAGEPVLKGPSFLTLFATHIHPTAQGPSGPPIPQGEASALSQKVLTG